MSFQAMAWAVDQSIPTNQKFVLLMLANRTNHDTGRCDPSHRRISEDCGMSVATVKRAIKQLVEDGYLSVEGRVKNGEKQSNQYLLHLDRVGSHRPHPQESTEGGRVTQTLGRVTQTLGRVTQEGGVGSHRAIKQELNQELNQEVKQDHFPAAASDSGEAVEVDVVGAKSVKPKTEKQQANADTWSAYSDQYVTRYGVEPVRNAKSNAQAAQLVSRLGADEAPQVAAYFVTINDQYLLRNMHDFGMLISKAEAIRTQWATGRQMNGRTARQMEDTQANINAAQEAGRMITQGGERNAFL